MSIGSSATVEGPSLSGSSAKSVVDSLPLPPVEGFDPHHADPADPLTEMQDENLKLQTGLAALAGVENFDAHATTNKAVRDYVEGNMALWRRNWGLPEAPAKKDEDVAGHTVRVDSDDKQYH